MVIAELNIRLSEYEEFDGLLGVIGENDCTGWAETPFAVEISNSWPKSTQTVYKSQGAAGALGF